MANGVGIIDADYYNNADNEGHIMVALMNMGTEAVAIPQGERIAQGIFYNYLTVDDDDKVEKAVRGGGFGSCPVPGPGLVRNGLRRGARHRRSP